MSSVAIVILNWNGKELLKQFLPSVLKYSAGANIYIADNCSSDDSVQFIEQNHPEVKLICNPENYGFAAGYNKALSLLTEDILILLNSDVEVTQNWLQPLVDILNTDQQAGCCQPKIKDQKRKKFFEYAGAAGGFIDKYGYPFCRGRIFNKLEEDSGQYDQPAEIFWASGACMAIKRKVFEEVNGFDEDFFAHMEEIDLCWRVKNKGYKVLFTPSSTVYHVGGATLAAGSPKKTYLNFRNNFIMLYKNLSNTELYHTLIIRLILDGVAGIKFLLEGNPAHTISVIKAHFFCYLNFRKLKQKRRAQESKPLKLLGQVYLKSLIIQYYLLGKKKFNQL